MLSSTLLVLASLLYISQIALAAPDLLRPPGQSMPLTRRMPVARSAEDWVDWAQRKRQSLTVKYSGSLLSKRNQASNVVTSQDMDENYFGSLSVGTPPTPFYVLLDTGSTNLWLQDINCYGCNNAPRYNFSSSSTFHNLSKPFKATYPTSQGTGYLVSDVVQMAGYSVSNQYFGAVTNSTEGLVAMPMSGLLGLAWEAVGSTGQPAMWETLVSKGAWSEPVMAFQLSPFRNRSDGQPVEPGGSFTMGFLNSSLYTGDIDYRDLVTTTGHWTVSLTNLTVQGTNIPVPNGSASAAAIDTGTSFIGGPSDVIQNVYAQIPGAKPGTGDQDGFWVYPCDTQVNASLSFGGPSWPMSPDNFRLTQIGPNECIGAFVDLHVGGDAPNWIIGAVFLRDVYSVYRYSPPSVGFAALSETALGLNEANANAPPPSATTEPVTTSVTATSPNVAVSMSGSAFNVFNLIVKVCGVVVGAMLV